MNILQVFNVLNQSKAQPILRSEELHEFLKNLPELEPEDRDAFKKAQAEMRQNLHEIRDPLK
ncbi:MAG: hypothetical protein HKM04_04355 [Legionellales bacterium]|nr:hypothetical protein [Legionellales bacterium]